MKYPDHKNDGILSTGTRMLFYLQRIRKNQPSQKEKGPTTVRQNSAWKPRTHPGAANEIPRSEK